MLIPETVDSPTLSARWIKKWWSRIAILKLRCRRSPLHPGITKVVTLLLEVFIVVSIQVHKDIFLEPLIRNTAFVFKTIWTRPTTISQIRNPIHHYRNQNISTYTAILPKCMQILSMIQLSMLLQQPLQLHSIQPLYLDPSPCHV